MFQIKRDICQWATHPILHIGLPAQGHVPEIKQFDVSIVIAGTHTPVMGVVSVTCNNMTHCHPVQSPCHPCSDSLCHPPSVSLSSVFSFSLSPTFSLPVICVQFLFVTHLQSLHVVIRVQPLCHLCFVYIFMCVYNCMCVFVNVFMCVYAYAYACLHVFCM